MAIGRRFIRGRAGAFTLVELLVVILILSVLMAIVLPLYLGTIGNAERRTCRANMQTIANAQQAHKVWSPTHEYTEDLQEIYINTGDRPMCPVNGGDAYSVEISDGSALSLSGRPVPAGGLVVRCNHPDHGVFAPGLDIE
ncbi:MAG TPA: type II secretion system protein [Chthonomonadales bacterium]|nr:type II secretion system protein [Chthonomonadales bacterium]